MDSTESRKGGTMKSKKIVVTDIKGRDGVRFGRKYEGQVRKGHHAIIETGKSITLIGTVEAGTRYVRDEKTGLLNKLCESHDYRKKFNVGDHAVYGSYNLIYTGEITAIGAKTVTIVEKHGRTHRLDLHEFSWRNWDYDAEHISRSNADTMMYI